MNESVLPASVVAIACAVGLALSIVMTRIANNSLIANMALATLFVAFVGLVIAVVVVLASRLAFGS